MTIIINESPSHGPSEINEIRILTHLIYKRHQMYEIH
jgi:hypothetical protein